MAVGKEDILKARTDKREYRRIVLPNSLDVLLISDPDTDKANTLLSLFIIIHESTILSLGFSYILFVEILKSVFYSQCAASMDVSVGSFSDPDGLEGLAHFLGNFYF